MKSYRELADKVFERRDKYLVARKRKRKKIIKRTSAIVCTLIVVLGLSAWHLDWFDSDISNAPTIYTQTNPLYGASNNGYPLVEVPPPTTVPTTQKTTPYVPDDFTFPLLPRPISPLDKTTTRATTSQTPVVIVGDSAWEQVMVYSTIDLSSSYSGINDWFVDNDKIHMITYRYNRYLIMDMNTGKLVTKVVLPDIPGAMRHVGDETWISFDTLKTIKVYDLKTGEFKRDIVLQQSVKNFQVYGDYLFYADTERASWLYRYNLKTGKIDSVYVPVGGTSCLIELNTKDNLVYFAGVGTTGCYLYALDMRTLSIKAQYEAVVANSGGLYYSDGAVYWAGKKLDPTTLSLIFEYERISASSSWRGTTYVANGFVITDGGLYYSNIAVRLCKFPCSSGRILDDGRIVGYSSVTDSNDNSHIQFYIGFNIFS